MAKQKNITRRWVAGALVIVAVLLTGAAIALHQYQHVSTQPTSSYNPQTKSSGSTKDSSGYGANVTDNNATSSGSSSSPSTATPAPSSSPSGSCQNSSSAITLLSPTCGAKVADGTVISGTSTTKTVNYRIKDNVAGVIASGQLTVDASGHFSGTISNFKAESSSGYIEVYYASSTVGPEQYTVQIPVTF